MSAYSTHMENHPTATISKDEYAWLQHIQRWGSDAYPVRKIGRKWSFERMFNVGGTPTLYTTQRKAIEAVELFYDHLLDKNAGREVGTTAAQRVAASELYRQMMNGERK